MWAEFKAALIKCFGLTDRQVKSALQSCRQKGNESIIAYFDCIDALREQIPNLADEVVLEVVLENALMAFKAQLAVSKAAESGFSRMGDVATCRQGFG